MALLFRRHSSAFIKAALVSSIATSLALVGCSDSGDSGEGDEGDEATPVIDSPQGITLAPENETGSEVALETRKLTGFESPDEFEQTIKQSLVNYYQTQTGTSQGDVATDGAVDFAVLSPAAPVPESISLATDADSVAGSTAGSDGGTGATTTNVQEIGVDEADRIKTDGRYLYVLDDVRADFGIQPLPIGPIIDLPIVFPEPLPVDVVDTEPSGDSVASSQFYQPNSIDLRILQLDGSNAEATLLHESTLQLEGQSVDGMYLHGDDSDSLVLTSTSHGGGYWDYWGSSSFWGTTTSSINRLNVSDRSNPVVAETASFNGQIISSRVVGDYMYLVARSSAVSPGFDPYNQGLSVEDAVAALDIASVLPQYHLSDGSSSPMAAAEDCFVTEQTDRSYYLPDIVTLAAINLNDLSVSDSVCYLGGIETLYASTSAVVLSNTVYDSSPELLAPTPDRPVSEEPVPVAEPVDTATDLISPDVITPDVFIPPPVVQTKTAIHQFNLDQGQLDYAGSGQVDGHISGSNQQRPFRFSHSNGYLRVVTENERAFGGFFPGSDSPLASAQDSSAIDFSPVFVSVLKLAGNGELQTVTRLPSESQPAHIGKPGEQLHASRFLGNKAYLVTFRQTDPLYVIDFSNPENPVIAGELEIEGYSDYLHPVGENHLLGLGRGAIPDASGRGDNGRGAFATGIKVSLFDISNPANPLEVQALEIGKRGSNSESLFDHRGVTYRPGSGGQPGRLAIGIDVNDIPSGDGFSQVPFHNWRETGLHTFEVHTGNNPGVVETGKMIVEAASPQNPWGPQAGGDRSVLLDDAVFYVHGRQVYSAFWGSVGVYNGPR